MKRVLLTIAALLVAGVFFGTSGQAEAAEAKKTDKKDTAVTYSYKARYGDNYSVLSRKAVQTYGYNEKVKITNAQVVAAETFLTSDAGFPDLNEGQKVDFTTAKIKAAVDKASKLTAAEQALWQTYVPYVDFNTRDNG